MPKREQVCVNLSPELCKFYEDEAARTDRSLAGQIRHILVCPRRSKSGHARRAHSIERPRHTRHE